MYAQHASCHDLLANVVIFLVSSDPLRNLLSIHSSDLSFNNLTTIGGIIWHPSLKKLYAPCCYCLKTLAAQQLYLDTNVLYVCMGVFPFKQ